MSGIEALDVLKSSVPLPNVVLLDVMMPGHAPVLEERCNDEQLSRPSAGMNGFECCRQIRQIWNRATLPVIMVSAKAESKSVIEGLEAGCNDYVSHVI